MKPAPTGREIEVYGGPSNRRPPRPMTGLFASLTPEQQAAALAYRGPDDHPGSPAATGEDRDWALHIFNRCKHSRASSHDIINDLAAERAAARARGVREGIEIAANSHQILAGNPELRKREADLIRALAAPETQDMSTDQPLPRWRHKKRGSVYLEIGTAQLQSAGPILEPTTLVIYCAEDGTLWARPVDEFMDGRFELLEPL